MKKGFTLIEILVVIAIIGILSAIVAASLGDVEPSSQVTSAAPITESYPEASNYAVDIAGALSADELADLNTRLKSLDTSRSQIGVLVLKSTKPLSIEEYAIKLAEKWKVGMNGLDNGAIIIIATEDRKVRLEIGYGLEGDIPDAVAGRIIRDEMTPLLKSAKWHDAIVVAIDSINNKIK